MGKSNLKTAWFTFGQCHVHRVDGFTYDCDVVVKITAEDPRHVMFTIFGNKWSMQYDKEPDLGRFYPRGVKELDLSHVY